MEPSQRPVGLIRELWNRVQHFVLPEETVSLKIVFDNVRNYFICITLIAAVLAMAAQFPLNSGGIARDLIIWPWSLRVFALVLLGANALQSWLIITKVTKDIGRLPRTLRPTWGKWRRRGMRFFLVILVAPVIFSAYQIFPALIVLVVSGR